MVNILFYHDGLVYLDTHHLPTKELASAIVSKEGSVSIRGKPCFDVKDGVITNSTFSGDVADAIKQAWIEFEGIAIEHRPRGLIPANSWRMVDLNDVKLFLRVGEDNLWDAVMIKNAGMTSDRSLVVEVTKRSFSNLRFVLGKPNYIQYTHDEKQSTPTDVTVTRDGEFTVVTRKVAKPFPHVLVDKVETNKVDKEFFTKLGPYYELANLGVVFGSIIHLEPREFSIREWGNQRRWSIPAEEMIAGDIPTLWKTSYFFVGLDPAVMHVSSLFWDRPNVKLLDTLEAEVVDDKVSVVANKTKMEIFCGKKEMDWFLAAKPLIDEVKRLEVIEKKKLSNVCNIIASGMKSSIEPFDWPVFNIVKRGNEAAVAFGTLSILGVEINPFDRAIVPCDQMVEIDGCSFVRFLGVD